MPSEQLALNVMLREGLRFDSFFAGEHKGNIELIEILQAFVADSGVQQNILWGENQSGKTHLLQAFCAAAGEEQRSVSYLPLKILESYGDGVLTRGLGHFSFIVVDDIDTIVGDIKWERALFGLINQTRERNQRLLLSSTFNPRHLKCLLPDLASRLIWGGSYQVRSLSDNDKSKALKARSLQRGFELSDRVVDYLFRHHSRDIGSLMITLDKLDKESLRQKTKITVPFVKLVLNN